MENVTGKNVLADCLVLDFPFKPNTKDLVYIFYKLSPT